MLADLIPNLRRKTYMFNLHRVPERFEIGHREHLAIIDALRRGPRKRRARGIRTHIENVKQSIIRKLSRILSSRRPRLPPGAPRRRYAPIIWARSGMRYVASRLHVAVRECNRRCRPLMNLSHRNYNAAGAVAKRFTMTSEAGNPA